MRNNKTSFRSAPSSHSLQQCKIKTAAGWRHEQNNQLIHTARVSLSKALNSYQLSVISLQPTLTFDLSEEGNKILAENR